MRWLSDEAVARLQRAADRPDLSGTRYTIREAVGRGGMGTVYLADDAVLERPVALKVLTLEDSDPSHAQRMLREARVMARLEHPGLVPVHDAGVLPDGRVFYAMKFVRGRRLDQYVAAAPTLSDRLAVFRKICDAVAFAHTLGVVHRDLKPENIMIGAFGEVLVLDWGVARRAEDPTEPGGTVVGTRAYMAPEQAEGETDRVDERADVYALGAILESLLCAPLEPAAVASRALRAVSGKAMALRPQDRYRSVAELSADVGRFLDGEAPAAYREGPLERAGRLYRRYRTAILLIFAYLVMRILLLGIRP
jgi:eukaryotic-like serine/threonine-protein kinase